MMLTTSNAALACLLALAAPAVQKGGGPPPPPAAPQGPPAAQGSQVGKGVGMVFPDLELPTVQRDRTVRLSSLRGKPMLVVEFAAGDEGSRRYLEGWHAASEPMRNDEILQVVGIAQEQHPDRTALYAQWKRLHWTILWDPLDIAVVFTTPHVYVLDSHGIVRAVDPDPKDLPELVASDYPKPADLADHPIPITPALLKQDPEEETPREEHLRAYARLLWGKPADLDAAIDVLAADAGEGGVKPAQLFRLGVAYRMRYDSPHAKPGDFQAAFDAWNTAVRHEPRVLVWRRRILQYGPRVGKPFVFYDWVPKAQAEIRARGEEPVALSVPLSEAEVASGVFQFETLQGDPKEPDPEGTIPRDPELVRVDTAYTFKPPSTRVLHPDHAARLHIAFTPNAESGARWCASERPVEVWLELPEGWRADRRLLRVPDGQRPSPSGAYALDVEVCPPTAMATNKSGGEGVVGGYALVELCSGESGEPVRRRVDFEVPIQFRSMYE